MQPLEQQRPAVRVGPQELDRAGARASAEREVLVLGLRVRVTTFSAAGRPLAVRTGRHQRGRTPHRGAVGCELPVLEQLTEDLLQAQGDSIQWSGGSSGRSGTGRSSSVQPSPNASCATPRQNRPAPALSCWNAIVHGPG